MLAIAKAEEFEVLIERAPTELVITVSER
jgi:hypothetical protein